MNVHNWLSGVPLHDGAKPYPVIEVSFNKGSRKDFYRNNSHHILEKNDWIAVEGVSGFDIGQVSLTGELVKLQMKKYSVDEQSPMKRVLRPASEEDLKQYNIQKEREQEILVLSRAIARTNNLEMKLCEVELQADGKKGTFFYTAEQRVDFRELIKVLASEFKLKVEMRQIGARQESGKVGGIGSCGRELCCSTWLTDFKSVNTTAARYQNLSINQTKLSGQCGRLKCCLNYELDTYMDALRVFPDNVETIDTEQGIASLQKRDIFKNLMWYSFSNSSKQYPLTIARVKEIKELNKQGIKADKLQAIELEVRDDKPNVKIDVGFVNDVGQMTLKSLEKGNKKNKQQGGRPDNARPAQAAQPQRQPNQGNRQGGKGQNPNARPAQQPQRQQAPNQPRTQEAAPATAQPQRAQQPRPEQRKPNPNAQQRPQQQRNPNAAPNPNQQKAQPRQPQPPKEGEEGQQPQGESREGRSRGRNRNRGKSKPNPNQPQPPKENA